MNGAPKYVEPGAGLAAIFLLLGVIGILLPRPTLPDPPDFELSGWLPNRQAIQPILETERALLSKHPHDAAAEKALSAFLELGAAEVKTGGSLENSEWIAANEKATRALLDYWYEHGEEAFRALGVRATDTFVNTTVDVLERARNAGIPVRQWLKKHAGEAIVIKLHAYGGTFIDHAVSWGLVTPENTVAGGDSLLLRINFRVRFFRLVNEVNDYHFLLDVEELRALWRWRIEGDKTLPMDQRMAFVKWLKNIEPDYRSFQVLGALYAKRGLQHEAMAMYREALLDYPFDHQLQVNLGYLIDGVKKRQ